MNDNKMKKEYIKPLVSVIIMEDLLETGIPVCSTEADEDYVMGKSHYYYDEDDDDSWNYNAPKSIWDE